MTYTLLDGGLGQELRHRSGREPTPLWSAEVLADQPDLVRDVHLDFLAAGADVITLASYAVTPARLAAAGRSDAFEPLQSAALRIARSALSAHGDRHARLAGCLPPLPGSYRPGERLAADRTARDYDRIAALQAPEVDLFLCETLPSVEEIVLATRAARGAGRPVWTSATVDETDGTRLRSGEPLAEGVDAALEAGAEAVLVNCAPPEAVGQALDILSGRAACFGAYANGFVTTAPLQGQATVAALSAREDLEPAAYAGFIEDWARRGATILGGCCEVGPAHIAELARRRANAGHG